MNGEEYLKRLGFTGIDINFPLDHIGEGDGIKCIFVNFERKTAIKWESGYSVESLIGDGLTDDEENKLGEIDGKEPMNYEDV